MSDNIKELVKRLRERYSRLAAESNEQARLRRQDERDAAADALEAMAGEVASLKLSNDLFQGAQKTEAEMNTQLTIQLHAIRAERDRLKTTLEGIARNADEATDLPLFRVQCRDFARKALGGDAS